MNNLLTKKSSTQEVDVAFAWARKHLDCISFGQVTLTFIVHDDRLTRIEKTFVERDQVVQP